MSSVQWTSLPVPSEPRLTNITKKKIRITFIYQRPRSFRSSWWTLWRTTCSDDQFPALSCTVTTDITVHLEAVPLCCLHVPSEERRQELSIWGCKEKLWTEACWRNFMMLIRHSWTPRWIFSNILFPIVSIYKTTTPAAAEDNTNAKPVKYSVK